MSMDFAAFADFWAPIESHDGPFCQALTVDYFQCANSGPSAP